jgi:predicted alpha/beta-hydrolase family hydrolase
MTIEQLTLTVSPEIGTVSAAFCTVERPVCIITLAHGAGAGMHHVFMKNLSEALAAENVASLRFNFPFAENKKSRPDLPVVAHKTIAAAVAEARLAFPSVPLFLSGKSFGGRMSSQWLSQDPDGEIKGIIFYGFPLHPPKKPSTERAEHLKKVKQPMLFIQGTRDELAELNLIESVCSSLPGATLVKLEGADHAFKAGKQNLIPTLAKQTSDWVKQLIR